MSSSCSCPWLSFCHRCVAASIALQRLEPSMLSDLVKNVRTDELHARLSSACLCMLAMPWLHGASAHPNADTAIVPPVAVSDAWCTQTSKHNVRSL